ncbi:GntR family transcriptional regulator, partial [Corynebacterium diphtheriae bv. mitis]
MRPDLVTNLPITLNRTSTDPIPTQIADHIRTLVGRGLLKPGDHVPSTRALSTQLDISRGSAVTVSYTTPRAHETPRYTVCRLPPAKKKQHICTTTFAT